MLSAIVCHYSIKVPHFGKIIRDRFNKILGVMGIFPSAYIFFKNVQPQTLLIAEVSPSFGKRRDQTEATFNSAGTGRLRFVVGLLIHTLWFKITERKDLW